MRISDWSSDVCSSDLPSTGIGKAYELPDVVRSTHSATTSDSFGLADIVGTDRPLAVPPPPPPRHSDIEIMARAALSLPVQIGATAALSALGVPAIGRASDRETGCSNVWI